MINILIGRVFATDHRYWNRLETLRRRSSLQLTYLPFHYKVSFCTRCTIGKRISRSEYPLEIKHKQHFILAESTLFGYIHVTLNKIGGQIGYDTTIGNFLNLFWAGNLYDSLTEAIPYMAADPSGARSDPCASRCLTHSRRSLKIN